jgi:amino acid transporter
VSTTDDVSQLRDEELLERLGYQQELTRSLNLWTNWAVGFAFISPVVGLYSIIAIGVQTSGPPWVWTLPIVLAGQVLVALVFAELASQFPIAGGIYQWSRRLVGPTYAWFAGWGYLWTLMLTVTAIAYFGGLFGAALFGKSPSPNGTIVWALGFLVITTAFNLIGIRILKYVVNAGITAELFASVLAGIVLVGFFRDHSFSSLFHSFGTSSAHGGSYFSAFFASMAFTGWAFVGFDACGVISEETKDATRKVPRAIVISLVSVGAVIILSALAIVLAVPSQTDVVAGKNLDPVLSAVTGAWGGGVEKPFLVLVLVAFLACGIAVQATAGRVAYSFARDGMLPGSSVLRRVTAHSKVPVIAILVTAVVSALALVFSKAQQTLIAFGSGGFYICFFLVCAAALYARLTGRWRPAGALRLGRWGTPINAVAVVWLLVEGLNIAWPRLEGYPWYQTWAIPFIALCLVVSGAVYVAIARPQERAKTSEALGDVLSDSAS